MVIFWISSPSTVKFIVVRYGGSSLGLPERLRSHSRPTSVEAKACAILCNRGCALGECTIQFTKSSRIFVEGPQSLGVECFTAPSHEFRRTTQGSNSIEE